MKGKNTDKKPEATNIEPTGRIEELLIDTAREQFAEPTYDMTFKMLFGTDENKDILISLLNSLLGFTGTKEIKDVQLKSNQFKSVNIKEIKGAIDVICTTQNNQKIAVEMQKKFKDYFLARSQSYMSKLIEGQVENKESQKYHEVLMDTYILAIAEENIFSRGKKDTIYERTVVPTIQETGEMVPDNKMYWKFFELPKFAASIKKQPVDLNSPLKTQWLDFFIKCNEELQAIPKGVNELIKKGYEIMKMMNWSKSQIETYKQQKEDKLLEEMEQEKLKLKGKIEGEISKVKFALENDIGEEKILKNIKFLNQKRKFDSSTDEQEIWQSNFNYIKEHIEDSDSVILGGLEQDLDF